jgi:tRNA-binding EMAP/Myf-like protein
MVFVCGLVLECEPVPRAAANLKICTVDVGSASSEPLSIVTNAPNIHKGTRTCVAMIGTKFEENGEEITVQRRSVGGVQSEGIICDSVMLGWKGGGKGLCVILPVSFSPGDPAPSSKPRGIGDPSAVDEAAASASAPAVKEKELTKEEKKAALAAEKALRKERLAAKRSAKKGGASTEGGEEGVDAGGVEEEGAGER